MENKSKTGKSSEPELKYGQIISISHFEDDFAFMHVDGHVKKNVMVRNFK